MKYNIQDGGSIEVINHTLGGDLLVVNAARCSFDKEHKSFDEKKDTKLIKYLAKHEHFLPFRHPSATLRIVSPVFVLRQLGKHQVGFSWSEVSRRYVTDGPKCHRPYIFRQNAENVKQGSSDKPLDATSHMKAHECVLSIHKKSVDAYDELLDLGVCPEQARTILPQSMYTTTVTTGTLLGWHHLYKLRTEEHTQRETQEYAHAIGRAMNMLFPISWKALNENITSN